MSILDNLPSGFLVLAPMDDVTDTVFRQIVAGCSKPDLFFTEFVNVEALQSSGRQIALRRLMFSGSDQPLIAQIWGKNPDNFYKSAQDLVEMGFAGVDLNFGCPDKKVVKNNTGGGTIRVPDQAKEIIDATRRGLGGKLPLSVKTRIGFKEYDESWIRFLLQQQLDMLSVHFRTVREMSKYPARWDLYADKIRQLRDEISPATKLVGNGDVLNRTDAYELAQKYSYDGVMIGRGVFNDPYIFSPNSPWTGMSAKQKIDLYKKHLRLYESTYPNGERKFDPIKKFCKIYVSNFDGASELRAKLMDCKTVEQSLTIIENI